MSYKIVMSKQQLQDLTRMTLETEEGDTVHGWVL